MLTYAGSKPYIIQLDESEFVGKVIKHGSAHLRRVLITVCTPLINSNYAFTKYYRRKISEGKHYLVTRTHMVKKLLRVIYTLEKTSNMIQVN